MDSVHGTGYLSRWVAPFRYLRIIRYLLLPAAFRSLSRLSSALSAKASTLRSFMLVLTNISLGSPVTLPSVAGLLSFFFLDVLIFLDVHYSIVKVPDLKQSRKK